MSAMLTLLLLLAGCSSGGSDGGEPLQDSTPQPGPNSPPDSPADPPDPPSALFILGDSLSDVGNAAGAADSLLELSVHPPTVGLCNPADVLIVPRPCDDLFYRQSRVTDGPVAAEYLAVHFGLSELVPSLHFLPSRPVAGTAYAVAGATARGTGKGDLSFQVDMLLLDRESQLPTDAVFLLMIGGNDAIDALQAAMDPSIDAPETSGAIVTEAVAAIGANIERLLDFGARRLIVSNVPDLATLPAIRVNAETTGDVDAALATANAISTTFNGELNALLDQIESNDQWLSPMPLALARFDLLNALFEARDAIATNAGNVLDACFDSVFYRDSPTAERVFHAECDPIGSEAPRFENFLFWDYLHPTGAAHAIVGAALTDLFPSR